MPISSKARNDQLTLEWGHTPAQGEADFLVDEGNGLAHRRIITFPDWPEPTTLLIGPASSGKSHLARIFADRSGGRFASTGELGTLATAGGMQPVIIEDVDRLPYDEAGLFHLLNQSLRDGRPVLMTAREEIAHWPYTTDDVRSRARRATAFTLEVSNDIGLSQILVKLFGDRQISVDPKVIFYLVARMERSVEEAVTLVDLMDRLALARGTAVTRSIAAEALSERQGEIGRDCLKDWESEDDERDE